MESEPGKALDKTILKSLKRIERLYIPEQEASGEKFRAYCDEMVIAFKEACADAEHVDRVTERIIQTLRFRPMPSDVYDLALQTAPRKVERMGSIESYLHEDCAEEFEKWFAAEQAKKKGRVQ